MTADQIADIARNDGDRTNLFADTYTVDIETSSGCAFDETITVNSSANHTDGGQITGYEISCDPNFDPSLISSISVPSGGGSGMIEYQWQYSTDSGSSWSDLTGATNETLDPSNITETTLYRRGGRLIPCLAWVYSNEIEKAISNNLTNAGAISGYEEFCNGYDPSLIIDDVAPSGGIGGSVEYQWQQTLDTTLAWVDIAGETSATLDPSPITQTTYYRRGTRRNPCTNFIYTNHVTKSVVDNFTDGGIIAGEEDFCGNYDPDIISSVTTPSGGTGGTTIYQWEQSTDSINWNAIGGSNTEAYNPTTVIQTTYFRRGARRSPCSGLVYSNVIKKMVVSNYTAGGIISGDQTVCGSYDPFIITDIQGPTGGVDGTLTYQWQQKVGSLGTWTPILGATSAEYDPTVITDSTFYRRQSRRAPCAAWINSNTITKMLLLSQPLKWHRVQLR